MTLTYYVWVTLSKKLNKRVNADLKHLVNWLNASKISFNVKKKWNSNSGVAQGSTLGTTLFLIYILDILMMLSVILVSMLIILLSILSVIRQMICGNNLNCLLNVNLICKTLWTGRRSGCQFQCWKNSTGLVWRFSGPIPENKSMGAIFQKKGKKG